MKIEELFQEHMEFDSKIQLLCKLEDNMKASVFNIIFSPFGQE